MMAAAVVQEVITPDPIFCSGRRCKDSSRRRKSSRKKSSSDSANNKRSTIRRSMTAPVERIAYSTTPQLRRSLTSVSAVSHQRLIRRGSPVRRQRTSVQISEINICGDLLDSTETTHDASDCSSSTPSQGLLPCWRCTCGQDNAGEFPFCGTCGTSKNWQCADCDFTNKCKFRFCGRCGIPKKTKPEEEEETLQEETVTSDQWKCLGCDQVNRCPYIFCSMCGSSKGTNEEEEEWEQVNFPPPSFVTCRPEDALEESLQGFESWTGEE